MSYHIHSICARTARSALLLASSLVLIGCGNDMSDLEEYVAAKKAERVTFIPDMPVPKPPEPANYTASDLRSPFKNPVDDRPVDTCPAPCVTPIQGRNREHLENFALDSLRMVGSLATSSGENTALVQTTDGLIHRVSPGNYVGENDGRIVAVTESSIEIIEIVPDGLGNYTEREAGIGLTD